LDMRYPNEEECEKRHQEGKAIRQLRKTGIPQFRT